MKFGLFYLFSDFGNISQRQLFNEVLEEIEYGEELGFDSVWLPEHHFAIYGMLGNPMILAAAIAQRTRTMKIGTAKLVEYRVPSTKKPEEGNAETFSKRAEKDAAKQVKADIAAKLQETA